MTYSPSTTSFGAALGEVEGALRRGAALFIPDHVARLELVLRQLARAAVRGKDGAAPMVLSTGEGLAGLERGRAVLEGVWIAPAAGPTARSAEFVATFEAREGRAADEQALLVWHALERAVFGGPRPGPRVFRVEGGRLVEQTGEATP